MRMTTHVRTLMRDADPAPRERHGGGERAQADLERMLRLGHLSAVTEERQPRQAARPPRRRTRLVPALAAVAACAAAAVAYLVLPLGSGETGYAATPPPLRYTHASTSVPAGSMLERLADRVDELREPAGPVSRVHQREWSLDTRIYADDSVTSEMVEQEYRRVLRPDGSGTTWWTDEDGDTGTNPYSWDPAPEDPEAFTTWLFSRPGDVGFGNAMGADQITGDLLRSQALIPAQRAALLRALAELPGLTYDGEVTDRAGRVGQAFSSESDSGGLPSRYTIIVDPDTGTILGQEQTLTETPGKLNVPIPSVISYTVYLSAELTS
jgi:hypothetical protein